MIDVTKYNQIERGEYLKPKYWARQRERNIYCYVDEAGRVYINAEFNDGKSMWVSTETKAGDLEINTAIFDLIIKTMDEEPSVWYASTFVSVRTAIRFSADRLDRACRLEALLREEKYMDFTGTWVEYTEDTPKKLAMQLFSMFSEEHSDLGWEESKLLEIKRRMDSFSTEGNWQYKYGSISPYIAELKKLKYLKISPSSHIRNLYYDLEKRAEYLYNEYQTRVR